MTYLIFDTETTGLVKNWKAPKNDFDNWPRLVQLAWIVYDDNGNEISRNDHLIKPSGFAIPKAATEVHGITTEIANEKGLPLREVMDLFLTELKTAKVLVGHNIDFDTAVLEVEFMRLDINHQMNKIKAVCTMKGTAAVCKIPSPREGFKWPRLSELHMHLFNEDFKEAHNAIKDAEACAKCFFELKKKGLLTI